MARVITYLNFPRNTEEAFRFYNVYINLEPDTKAETKKLFDDLSAGGKITMELQEMFWGAYYGSCTDKFGVQRMFNCTEK